MADAKHGVEVSLHIGQRVRHRDHAGKRVTGVINSLQIESEHGLTASVILDEPIIIPAYFEGDRETRINWQTCPVSEFAPFDERDEMIVELIAALDTTRQEIRAMAAACGEGLLTAKALAAADIAIAKATGSAS